MKKYRYYIMCVSDMRTFDNNFLNIETDEDIKKLNLPDDVDYVYKEETDLKNDGEFYFIGYPASITDVIKEVEKIKAKSDSNLYMNYLKQLNDIVSKYIEDDKNDLLIYKTQNGIFDYGSKQEGILVSPTIFAENNSNNEQLNDNKDQFNDKSYIDLE